MDTIEELDRNRELASTALKEKLTDARKDRPEMLDEITVIERALEKIEDVDNYVERFNELEVLVRSFLADAESQPPNCGHRTTVCGMCKTSAVCALGEH